jgi:hypothetical protein
VYKNIHNFDKVGQSPLKENDLIRILFLNQKNFNTLGFGSCAVFLSSKPTLRRKSRNHPSALSIA